MRSLSQSQFAALPEVARSRQFIGRLCAARKLPMNADKSIPMPAGLEAFRALAHHDDGPTPELEAEHAAETKLSLDTRRAVLAGKAHRAKLLDLEFRRRSGELLRRVDVEAEGRAIGAAIRERLLSLPPRVALQLEALCASGASTRAAAIEALLADEINAVLAELHALRLPESAT